MPDQSEDFEIAVLEEYKSLPPDLNPASAEKKYLEEAMYLGNGFSLEKFAYKN